MISSVLSAAHFWPRRVAMKASSFSSAVTSRVSGIVDLRSLLIIFPWTGARTGVTEPRPRDKCYYMSRGAGTIERRITELFAATRDRAISIDEITNHAFSLVYDRPPAQPVMLRTVVRSILARRAADEALAVALAKRKHATGPTAIEERHRVRPDAQLRAQEGRKLPRDGGQEPSEAQRTHCSPRSCRRPSPHYCARRRRFLASEDTPSQA
jgi:hypothetical protein